MRGPLRHPRVLTSVAVGLLLLILGGIVAALFRTPPLRFQRMPDGTELAVAGVTYGMEHRFVWGNGWQRLLLPLLPDEWNSWMGGYESSRLANGSMGNLPHKNNPTLFLWLVHRSQKSQLRNLRAMLVDGAGDEAASWPYGMMRSATPLQRSGEWLETWEFAQFPRRSRTFGLRFYPNISNTRTPQTGPLPSATLVVSNPDAGPHPVWQPESLPSTKQDGDFRITLDRLVTGARDEAADQPALPGQSPATVLLLRLQPRRQEEIWNSRSVEILDAAGNDWMLRGHGIRHTGGDGEAWTFSEGLWSSEPAYRVQIEMARTDNFPPDVTWKLPPLPLPERGKLVPYALRKALPDATVDLVEAEDRSSPPVGSLDDPRKVTVRFRVTGAARGKQLNYVEGWDERHRAIHMAGVEWKGTDDPQGDRYTIELRVPAGARRMLLSVAAERSRHFEFLAPAASLRR